MKDYKSLKVEDLPEVFQKRVERFNKLFEKGTEDHHDFEHHFDDNGESGLFNYEMFCLQQAFAFIDIIPTEEILNQKIEELKSKWLELPHERYSWENNKDYKNRIELGPDVHDVISYLQEEYPDLWVSDEHSENTMGCSWHMFIAYLKNPQYVIYMHGALAPLIGDEGYYDDRSDIPDFE